jgi:thiamine biosynthesis protein ThiI
VNSNARIQTLPFYQLHKRYTELDKNTHYLLYCERGVMSRLQAQFLQGEGFDNISVYQPPS